MFPPMTPMTERIRVQNEMAALTREATLRAQMRRNGWFAALNLGRLLPGGRRQPQARLAARRPNTI